MFLFLVFTLTLLAPQLHAASNPISKLSHLITEKCPEWGQLAEPCYVRTMNRIISGVAPGVPELGIPTLEPLVVNDVNFTLGGSETTKFTMAFDSMTFSGLGKTKVDHIKVGNPIRFQLSLPKLRMTAPYQNEGRLAIFRTTSKGEITFHFAGVKMEFALKYDEVRKEGERYAVIEGGQVRTQVEKALIQLDKVEGSGSGTQELLNAVLATSSHDMVRLLLPHVDRAFSERFVRVARDTLADIPLSSVFSPWTEPPSNY